MPEEPREALKGLSELGLLAWSGRKLRARKPVAKAKGKSVAVLYCLR
jgi:hypothetical protein